MNYKPDEKLLIDGANYKIKFWNQKELEIKTIHQIIIFLNQ